MTRREGCLREGDFDPFLTGEGLFFFLGDGPRFLSFFFCLSMKDLASAAASSEELNFFFPAVPFALVALGLVGEPEADFPFFAFPLPLEAAFLVVVFLGVGDFEVRAGDFDFEELLVGDFFLEGERPRAGEGDLALRSG